MMESDLGSLHQSCVLSLENVDDFGFRFRKPVSVLCGLLRMCVVGLGLLGFSQEWLVGL